MFFAEDTAASFLFVVLEHIEVVVSALFLKQLLMRALLCDFAVGKINYIVRVLYRREAVCDDEHRAAVASSSIIISGLWIIVLANESSWR